MFVEGKKLGANYVSDVALPLVLRMQLAQPIMSGDDAADFCVAERLGDFDDFLRKKTRNSVASFIHVWR